MSEKILSHALDSLRVSFPGRTTRVLATCALAVLAACGGGGGGPSGTSGGDGSNADLTAMHYGRLVDVYGLQKSEKGSAITLYQADVLIGPDIQDERDGSSAKRDPEILYDFISADPDTLQPRLFITREIGSKDFQEAFAALGAKLRLVAPAIFGQDTTKQPYTIVPRNGAIQLTFSASLGIDDSFFVERDASGKVIGVKNSEAVQLLKIVGNPLDTNHTGDFEVIPARIIPRGNKLVIDPVLLGSEGLQYQTRNNAAGLPEAPDQKGSNIRIALALAGALRIRALRPDVNGQFVGYNNAASQSIIRDFRSGNALDSTAEISQGFVRDPIPPRIVGELPFYLERVEPNDLLTMYVTLYKGGIAHEIDRGDALRVVIDNSGVPAAVTEVVEKPIADDGKPTVQHVKVLVRRASRLFDPDVDPTKKPGYPADPTTPDGEAWLKANAPRAVLIAEFLAERAGGKKGDDERYFVTFAPAPLPLNNGQPSPPNENISPFAGAIVRFTKPVDFATVRGLDSFFFATRDVLSKSAVDDFIAEQGIDPAAFRRAKFITPHLVAARVYDEDGSQTAIRLQSPLGFYLDEKMRLEDEGKPFAQKKYRYFAHLLAGTDGIRDLSGNTIDFQSESVRDALVIPFSLDTRKNAASQPFYPDNLTVTVARRLADSDEDEQPSYYLTNEVPKSGVTNALAYNLQDVFGAVVYLPDGTMQARPSTRVRKIVDDLNQLPPPSQNSIFRYCPETVFGESQVASPSAGTKFGAPIQNPLNPYGCRLQTVWREIDMSLSRTDAFDFNLDVEQMFWAPFTGAAITYDEFDRMSLFLGHSERRPEPCVGSTSALASLQSSGLINKFEDNFVYNSGTTGTKQDAPNPFAAYQDRNLLIDSSLAFTEPNGVNRYLPLPKFDKPYFVWRDETVMYQGGNSLTGSDVPGSNQQFKPYIISPFLGGKGRYVTQSGQTLAFNNGFWGNMNEYWIAQSSRLDNSTGGQLGTIALPLLADFWVFPDSSTLPKGNPFFATGSNGWQIALAVTSGAQPNFRALSGGGLVAGKPQFVDPTKPDWASASGAFTPTGGRTAAADNSVYWVMADFVKRQTVVTAGFMSVLNPHRMPAVVIDPRLGPYFDGNTLPPSVLPRFGYDFEPPLNTLPGGTSVVPEFRGAGVIDTLSPGSLPWRAWAEGYTANAPSADNFALDPLKAGDAHIRKFDDRPFNGQPRLFWTYYYNRNVTRYTSDPNALMDARFTSQFAGANETFLPQDVKYLNWRFIMINNVDANPPVSPKIQSFALTYRFEKTN